MIDISGLDAHLRKTASFLRIFEHLSRFPALEYVDFRCLATVLNNRTIPSIFL